MEFIIANYLWFFVGAVASVVISIGLWLVGAWVFGSSSKYSQSQFETYLYMATVAVVVIGGLSTCFFLILFMVGVIKS